MSTTNTKVLLQHCAGCCFIIPRLHLSADEEDHILATVCVGYVLYKIIPQCS